MRPIPVDARPGECSLPSGPPFAARSGDGFLRAPSAQVQRKLRQLLGAVMSALLVPRLVKVYPTLPDNSRHVIGPLAQRRAHLPFVPCTVVDASHPCLMAAHVVEDCFDNMWKHA
jgi:hypothetical protein